MENQYEKMSLAELRSLAKEKGITGITAKKKQELAELLKEMQGEAEEQTKNPGNGIAKEVKEAALPPKARYVRKPAGASVQSNERRTPYAGENAERRGSNTGESAERRASYAAENAERGRSERGGYGSNTYGKADNRPRGGYGRGPANEKNERGAYSERTQSNPYTNQYNNSAYTAEQRENTVVSQAAQGNAQMNANYRANQALTPEEMEQLDSGETKEGILEIMQEGYGFIRCDNYLPGANDVYVSPMQIRKMNLKTGDIIVGNTKVRTQTEKFSALLYVSTINGLPPAEALKRPRFEDLTPIFPNKRIHLETPGCKPAMRIVDLVSPIGKGQRGMIVSQPKAGKTTLLKQIAHAVTKNHPEMHMIILLIDERPEEVTDIKESIQSDSVEVIYSTFDELPDNHKRVSEMVIERAKRLVEHGKDVIILLDSITRLARAYNLTVQSTGRTLSGGLDPSALHMPKKIFGAARNMREGGSLTILATALVDTGSRMDDVVFEEFKGTGNMELVLDRNLSERRIFPAIDLPRSSTRRDDLLLSPSEMEANTLMRRAFSGMKSEEAVERIIQMFASTKNNAEFIETIKKTKFAY